MRIEHPQPRDLPHLKMLWQEAFGDTDAFIDLFFTSAFSPARCLIVRLGDALAAAAYWFDCSYGTCKAAYIYAVATAKAHQGKGCCRALMDAIADELRKEGYACAILVPGDASLSRMYSAMGYRFFGGMDTQQICACGPALPITQITAAEYSQARRALLPVGGVLQEGENMAFLSRYCRFYQGECSLLAAFPTENALFVPEFWGNPTQMPRILAAISAPNGIFRTRGSQSFAMCRMLTDGEMPTYFGFAFD